MRLFELTHSIQLHGQGSFAVVSFEQCVTNAAVGLCHRQTVFEVEHVSSEQEVEGLEHAPFRKLGRDERQSVRV